MTITQTKVIEPLDSISEEEAVELARLFSLSTPIRIPKALMSPDYEYRYVNRQNMSNYMRRRALGWTPVKWDELYGGRLLQDAKNVEKIHTGTHKDADGCVALGDDMIMMKLPKRIALALRERLNQLNRERVTAGRRRFHMAGELSGVKTHEQG